MPTSIFTACILLGSLPARGAETFREHAYYFGDLHAHSGYSGDAGSADIDGDCEGSCGDLEDMFQTARDNGLDFVSITDHVNGNAQLDSDEFLDLNDRVIAANDPTGGFVTLPGAEVWIVLQDGTRLGHRTLLYFGSDATLAGLSKADAYPDAAHILTTCEDIWTWMADLTTTWGPALLIAHHPAVTMPMPTDWSCNDATYAPAVEIYSEHGSSVDDGGYDIPGEGLEESGTVETALDPDGYGLFLSFIGGTDSHDTRPGGVCETDTEQPTHLYAGGLTIAVLDATESLSRSAIYDAILAGRTMATSGPRVPVDVAWSAGEYPLASVGEPLDAPEAMDLDVTVSIPPAYEASVTAVSVVGPRDTRWDLSESEAGVWGGTLLQGTRPEWVYVEVELDGAVFYPDGCDDGGDDREYIWTSPWGITEWEDDTDGDGVSWLDGDCDDTDPATHTGATEIWYDGKDQACDDGDDWDQDGDGVPVGPEPTEDCDDTDPEVYPGAGETWYDGIDQDCDGASDFDQDHDGWDGEGGSDCDDLSASVNPDQIDSWYDGIDQDCDGASDFDQDGDGSDSSAFGGDDCDDADPAVHPGAAEIWYDGFDQDCDPMTELDADGDGVPIPLDCHDDDALRTSCEPTAPATCGAPSPVAGAALLAALLVGRRRW